jgi:predicted phosphodiesterase
MFAVLSDIHGNLEALDAVRADLARRPVSAVYCLGDLVGYGPNPVECIEAAREWDVVLTGDCDSQSLVDDIGFSPTPIQRELHLVKAGLEGASDAHWDFLAERPRTHREGDFLFVHGSPRNPLNEYVFPEDVYNQRKMDRIGELLACYCFCGHTHVPGVFVQPFAVGEQWQFYAPEERHHFWRFDGRKTIVNVGSVGQPRDGDRRAGYVTVDGWDVHFHRVEYDCQTTRDKIYAIPDLDNFHGDRLEEGR